MANELTLLEIDGKEINKYIIINNPEKLNDNDIKDSGDIVILDNGERTDLYIGDEHIAGGYGFNEKETAELVLDRIKNLEERTFDFDLENKENDKSNKLVSIDQENNKIIINDSIYELKVQDKDNVQELYIEQYFKPSIFNLKFFYSNNNKLVESKNEYIYDCIDINSLIPSLIEFDYNGTLDIKQCEIIYNYEYISTNDTKTYVFDLENSIIPEDRIPDNNLGNNIFQKTVGILFTETDKYNFKLKIGNKECIANLKIRLTLDDNTTIIKTFAKWVFIYPCIYGTGITNIDENIENNQNIFSLGFNNSVKIRFNHGNTVNSGVLYVPQTILGKSVENYNIVCISNASNLRFNWITNKNSKDFISSAETNIHYWILTTPQQYKGDVEWTFSLN